MKIKAQTKQSTKLNTEIKLKTSKNHITNFSDTPLNQKNPLLFSDKTRDMLLSNEIGQINDLVNDEENLPARSRSQINEKLLMQNLVSVVEIDNNVDKNMLSGNELNKNYINNKVRAGNELSNSNLQIQNELSDNNLLGKELGRASSENVNSLLLSKENNKENKGSKNVTQMVINLPPEINIYNINNYLNVSANYNNVEDAAVTRMVRELPHEQYLLSPERSPGSIPGRSDSTSNDFKYKIKKVEIQDIKSGDYVLSLNETSGKVQPAEVKALLDMGEKPIYELTTESGRAINTTGNHPYLVRSKKEFQREDISNYSLFKNSLMNLSVVNILTNDCCLRCGSLDQTSQFNFNASATKSTSFLCGIDSTLGRNFLYSSIGMNSTNIANSLNKSLNSFLEIPVFRDISSEFLLSSSNANSGAKKSKSWSTNTPLVNESFQKKVNKTFESTTNFIYIRPFDFNSSYLPCLDALCNLTDQSIMSLSSCKCFSNLCINKDNFIPEISTCFSNSAGISTLIVTFSMIEYTDNKYLNVSNGIACLQKLPAHVCSQIDEKLLMQNLKCVNYINVDDGLLMQKLEGGVGEADYNEGNNIDGVVNKNYVNSISAENSDPTGMTSNEASTPEFGAVNSEPNRSERRSEEKQSEENLYRINNMINKNQIKLNLNNENEN